MSGLINRILRVFKGKTRQGVDPLADSSFETTLNQTIEDMEAELNAVITTSVEAMSRHDYLEAEFKAQKDQALHWQQKAKQDLLDGNEASAKKQLLKKVACDRRISSMTEAVAKALESRAKLQFQVDTLRTKIIDAKKNAAALVVRKKAAAAQKKVALAMVNMTERDNAFDKLQRLEDKVARDEAAAKAYDDITDTDDLDLRKEQDGLDLTEAEAALAALKAEIAASDGQNGQG